MMSGKVSDLIMADGVRRDEKDLSTFIFVGIWRKK